MTDLVESARQRRPGRVRRGDAQLRPRRDDGGSGRRGPRASGQRATRRRACPTTLRARVDSGTGAVQSYTRVIYDGRPGVRSPRWSSASRSTTPTATRTSSTTSSRSTQEEKSLEPGQGHAGDGRAVRRGAARGHRLARGAAGRHARADGGRDRRAAVRRAAAGADEGHRRGRHRAARRGLQQDGAEPPARRSSSWRTCRGCSGGSSPTCRTSCGRR